MQNVSISNAHFFWRLIKSARRDGFTPLGSETRAQLQNKLGFDLPVAIYRCSGLLQLGARAFAFDNGVYLDRSQPASRSLLLHEIAHLLQQRSGRVKNAGSREIAFNLDEDLETEADRIAGALHSGGALPPWVHKGAVAMDAGVVQFLKLILMKPDEVSKWNTFKDSAKAAGVKETDIATVLDHAPNFHALEPLLNQFVDPAPGFDAKAAVSKFLSTYRSAPAPAPSASTGAGPSPAVPASAPPKTVWGTPAVASSKPASPPTPVKMGAASAADNPGALTAEHAAQNWEDIVEILKKPAKPANVTAVKANKMLSTSGETREAEIMLKFSNDSSYKFVLHYHPQPKGANWLHFKNSQTASTNHQVNNWNHWAIKAAGIKEEKFKTGHLT